MVDKNTLIKVGSIIHLKSALANGGYLDTRGRVMDKQGFFAQQYQQGAKIFVFTYGGENQDLWYEGANRDLGSGSWRILAASKAKGEVLVVGDQIQLKNWYPNVGYLDVIDDIKAIKPFKSYAAAHSDEWGMAKGIFTAVHAPTTWTIRSEDKAEGESIFSDDTIRLESTNAGFLQAYTHKIVTQNEAFTEYAGQQYFVFANPTPQSEHGADSWKMILSHLSHNIYHIETKPSHESVAWDAEGMFEIGGREEQPVKRFEAAATDDDTLEGHVTYINESSVPFKATLEQDNLYAAFYQADTADSWQPDGLWKLGTTNKKIAAIEIQSEDGGYAFNGTIRYKGGNGPLVVRGRKAKPQKKATTSPDKPLPEHANSMRVVMDSTNRLLNEALITMLGGAQDAELNQLLNVKAATGKHDNDLLKELKQIIKNVGNSIGSEKDTDYTFHVKQLIKLYILSKDLNAFLLETLPDLIIDQPFHLVRKSLRLAATDHESIQRATLQRRWNKHVNDKYYISDHARRVLLMDKLAFMSVAPFQHLLLGDPEQLRVVTYFSTKTHIHHIPYDERDGRFVLIGVSYDYDRVSPIGDVSIQLENMGERERAFELMAIPHEVGHYIYRYARLASQKIDATLKKLDNKEKCANLSEINTPLLGDNPQSQLTFMQLSQQLFHKNAYTHWCEDIFADVYGCVVGGPLSVVGLQAMLGATDTNQAWTNDEKHPTPVVRPFLLSESLRILNEFDPINYPYADVISQLDQTWADALKEWGYTVDKDNGRPTQITQPDKQDADVDSKMVFKVDEIMQEVCPMLYTFVTLLVENATFDGIDADDEDMLPTKIPWSSSDHKKLREYDAEIEQLIKEKISQKGVVGRISSGFDLAGDDTEDKETLQAYLDNWGDSGPLGHGDHPD